MGAILLVAFVCLVGAYLVSSAWAGLDSRYPVLMAVGLLICGSLLTYEGNSGLGNEMALFSFFLLFGGVVLLSLDRLSAAKQHRTSTPVDPPARV